MPRSIDAAVPPCSLRLASLPFACEPPLFRGAGWPGRPAFPRATTRLLEKRAEPRASGFAVLSLGAVLTGIDEEHSLSGHAAPRERMQALLHLVAEIGRCDIKAKLHSRRDLVDVLPAWTGRAHKTFFDGQVRKVHGSG